MILGATSSAQRISQEEWWKRRGYERNPLFTTAESIPDDIWKDRLNEITPLDSPIIDEIIAPNMAGPVLIWGVAGGGKTFFCKLAAQICRDDPDSCGSVEVTFQNLSDAQVLKNHGTMAGRIARCVYKQLAALHGHSSSSADHHSLPESADLGHILAKCGDLAASLCAHPGKKRAYVFLDGLDYIYGLCKTRNAAQTARFALANFVAEVAAGAGGDRLAFRIFLPRELREFVIQSLPGDPRRVAHIELPCQIEDTIGAVELWLDVFYAEKTGQKRPHLLALLAQDAVQELYDSLKRRQRQHGGLSPRDAIEMLRAVSKYAAQQGIIDRQISGREFKDALKAVVPPNPEPLHRWHLLLCALLAVVVLLALFYVLPRTPLWGMLLQRLPRFDVVAGQVTTLVKDVITWLEKAKDFIEVILLIIVVLAAAIFVAGCWRRSHQAGEPLGFRRCLEYAWQYVRRYLPGGG